MKTNVMINEIDRILRNCSIYLGWEEKAKWIEHFVQRLQFSGYDQEFRHKVVEKALRKHDQRIERYTQTNIMYPIKTQEEKQKAKREKNEWYARDGKFESVMFVEATPGGRLKKQIQQTTKRMNLKIKIVERVSSTIKHILQKSDPFEKVSCWRLDCEVCRRGNYTDCKESGCVYELTCRDRRYRGTTARTTYHRTKEEVRDWLKQEEDSPLWKHSQMYHNGGDFEFDIRVIGRCFGKPSRRRITEAVRIDELDDEKTMNSKGEWSYIKLSKVVAT